MIALLLAVFPATVQAAPSLPDYVAMDAGPELRAWQPIEENIATSSGIYYSGGSGNAELADYEVGDSLMFLGLDNYAGSYYFKTFTLMGEGGHSELWLADDFQFEAGDPRNPVEITQAQIDYLLNEVDQNIYETVTSYFGTPDNHDGSYSLLEDWGYVPEGYYQGSDKLIILVDNIRDDNFYDPTYPLFIAGFYSSTLEAYFDRNVITIDTWQWEERVGPDGSKPYDYEATIAHEFQHLIHDDIDFDEELFVNEGCSDFSEFICGYGHPNSHLFGEFGLISHPENSLVVWEDQGDLELLADYGISYLWTLYLYEQLGGDFIQNMVNNMDNGITGIEGTLVAMGYNLTFATLFNRFSVAMLIDSDKFGGMYGFQNIDFTLNIGTPADPNTEAYDTPGAAPWGTDYMWVSGVPSPKEKLYFAGDDISSYLTKWTSDGDVLWSGTGDLIDNWAIFEAAGGGTLSFDTIWDFEDYWDFGFVQVSTDGGYTWASLSNAYTTSEHDPGAHPKVVANLPGLTSYVTDWVSMEFDLSTYAGQDVLIAFRHITDWATHYGGWYIDNVYVDSTLISDGSDASIFKDITEVVPMENDFSVTFVAIKEMGKGNQYKVLTMGIDDMTETGTVTLASILGWSNKAIMLVTFEAQEGISYYADYSCWIA